MHWRIFHREVTRSTNLDAREGVPGDVFTADYQTAGRGRLDHKWLSPPKTNLMMSVVFPIGDLPPETLSTFPLVVGLAVCRAVGSQELKWPNDVLMDGKKLAGILCERVGDNVIAGIGVNVLPQVFPPEIVNRATTLSGVTVSAVRDKILASLSDLFDRWHDHGFAAIYPELKEIDFLRGKFLAVRQSDDDLTPVCGQCGGITPDGSLLVGETKVYAGEAHITSVGYSA